MKKKILALLLCTAMTATALTACGNNDSGSGSSTEQTQESSPESTPESTSEATPEPSKQEPAQAEELPTPKYYFSFDEADGTAGITPAKKGDGTVDPVDKEVVFIPGVKGEAAYIDGTYGLKLSEVNGVGDTYSLSYWMYANRNANFMPTTQYGPDVHGDATGGQHYLNITWADWSGASEFPCVWSYDQNAEGSPWPNWYPESGDTHLNQWINITLVVDPSQKAEDGNQINATIYVNGEAVEKPVNIIGGTMAPSDNFDFLLGVNYWDAMLKGAFDELYIFDTVLTPGQVKTLYEAGDPTVKFEAPERVVEVTVDENALETIGNTDLNAGWWSDWTSAYEIPEGVTRVFKLNNFSSGLETWHNYVMVFANEATEAHKDPNASEAHKEWAAIRADAYGWMGEVNSNDQADKFGFTWTWGNWDSWKTVSMVDADVTVEVKREDNILNITAHNVDYNGLDNTMTAKVETAMTADDPCYMFFTCESSYVELLSVEDGVDVKADSAALETLGTTTFGLGWWQEFTNSVELKEGESKTVKLKNYSSGVENWHNYVVAFTNTQTTSDKAPSADNYEGYAEYAVVRADLYGWGDASYAGAFDSKWIDGETAWSDWEAWKDAMRDVDVTLVITRSGSDIVIDSTFVDRSGNEFTSKSTITSTLTADAPCYFFFTGEQAYIELMSVE